MQIQENKKLKLICAALLYAAPVAGAGTFWLFSKGDGISMLSNIVIMLISAGIYYTLLHMNREYLYGKIYNPLLYFGCFFLSFVLLGGKAGFPLGVFWMLVVVMAALDSGLEVALATHAVLMVQYAVLLFPEDKGFYRFSAYILLGIVVALLFSQLIEKRAIPYLILILLCCDGVLQCVVYQFNLKEISAHPVDIIMELFSLLVFVAVGYLYLSYREKSGQAEEFLEEDTPQEEFLEADREELFLEGQAKKLREAFQTGISDLFVEGQEDELEEGQPLEEEPEEPAEDELLEDEPEEPAEDEPLEEEPEGLVEDEPSEEQIESGEELPETEPEGKPEKELWEYTAPGFELLEYLKEYSESLYLHSEKIALLSEKAAQAIGANAALAKAGGFYHEIGRVEEEENYIEAGTQIGKAYDFPEELLAVMRQHSTSFELPKSVEAAVVMLSDCIISTSDFLMKNGKREKISNQKLVTSIFQNRLEKGNLEQSGMTSEQIKALKEFYINNTFTEE